MALEACRARRVLSSSVAATASAPIPSESAFGLSHERLIADDRTPRVSPGRPSLTPPGKARGVATGNRL